MIKEIRVEQKRNNNLSNTIEEVLDYDHCEEYVNLVLLVKNIDQVLIQFLN